MKPKTYIRLPLHTSTDYVLTAIAAAFGDVTKVGLGRFENKRSQHEVLDLCQPCGPLNGWHIRVDHNEDGTRRFWYEMNTEHHMGEATLFFHDKSNTLHSWECQMESGDEQWRWFIAESNGLSVAMGQRLIDLFGGEMVPNSQDDTCPVRIVKKPALPLIKNENANERFYRHQNEVAKQTLLTSDEIQNAQQYAAEESGQKIRRLIQMLDKVSRKPPPYARSKFEPAQKKPRV